MSSDSNPVRTSGDSSAADDAPCTSSAGPGGRKVKLVCAYGGKILPRPIDGVLRYAGGESRIINIRRDAPLPEFLRKMSDTYGGSVAVRYQLPDEDLDALISVSTPEDLENMMEEVDDIAEGNPSAKLRVFLFSPSEVVGVSMDQHYSAKDRQDQNTMYIEAVNGLDNRLPRKDSMASVSSTQNSDGAIGAEAVADGLDEGTAPALLSTNAHDQSQPVIAVRSMHDLSTAINSIDQNEVLSATQSELPPSAPYFYVNPHHSQFTSSLPSVVAGLHQQVTAVPLPPASYVPGTHDTLPLISQPGNDMAIQRREDPILEDKTSVGKIAKVPNEPTVQPLPPLPPAHFLAPKGQIVRLEECSLCQKSLTHSHSEAVINDQVNGSRIVKPILQIHVSDDITKTRDPQVGVIGGVADNVAEVQPGNFVSAITPLVSYETACNIERPDFVVTNNLDQTKSFAQCSAALAVASPAARDTVTDLQTVQQDAPMQTKQVLPHALGPNWKNNDLSILMCQPAPSLWPGEMLNGPPKSCWVEDLQGQLLYPQHMVPLKHEPGNQPLVADASSIRDPNLQEDVFAQFSSYSNPAEGMIGSFCVSSSRPSALNDQPKLVMLHNVATSKDSRPDILSSLMENSIAAKPLDEPNTIPLNDLLFTSGVVPSEHTCLQIDQLVSTEQEYIYIKGPQAAKASHNFHATGDNPLIDMGMPDYTYNSSVNEHPTEDKKGDSSKSQAKEIFEDILIPFSGNAQIDPNNQITNTEALQGQVSSDSLFFNDDPQKILGSAPISSPSPTNVSEEESIVMKETLTDIQSLDTKVTAVTVSEGVSTCPSQSSKDLGTDLLPSKDYEHIDQDMSASAEERVAPVVYLTKPSMNYIPPHHPNNEERGTNEDSVDRADEKDETIEDAKQSEKLINGFPSMVDIGHLQVLKNSDLEELRELGSGTYGTVYHGKWRGSDVAIKRLNELVFNGKPSDQERARADFWNEACKLSSLHHPNVVTLYGVVLDGPGGTISTVTEFMVNGSLRNALARNDKILDWRKRLLIAMDVAFGMEYLHSRNIIHFDLKSDNLLVNLRDPQRPICKVGDLGLSRVKFETLMSGGMRGTLPWMAPELLDGKTKCTEKIDVYSFGIVMWELLTGDEPYADLRYGAIIGGIVNNTLRPPVPESCDPEWSSLMEQCWSVEPTERPSFMEIASRLRSMGASYSSKRIDHTK